MIGHHATAGAATQHYTASTLAHDAKPSFSSARMVCAPETRGRLGIHCHLKGRNQRLARRFQGKFFQVELSGFLKIGQRFLDRFTLRGRAGLGIERSESAFRGWDEYCSEQHFDPQQSEWAIIARSGSEA